MGISASRVYPRSPLNEPRRSVGRPAAELDLDRPLVEWRSCHSSLGHGRRLSSEDRTVQGPRRPRPVALHFANRLRMRRLMLGIG